LCVPVALEATDVSADFLKVSVGKHLAKIDMEIRKAVEADIPNLLLLMRELAEFEKYARDFAVTEAVLHKQGFKHSPPDFHCLIAEEDGELVGFLVYYFVPFTYRAKPNLIIKELYIAGQHRSRGAGKLLMKAVAREAVQTGCGMIKWWVAKWNERGIEFYKRLGAGIDSDWHEFQLSESAFRDLAEHGSPTVAYKDGPRGR
jgi:GNAT superfamily N-acetyltransferase